MNQKFEIKSASINISKITLESLSLEDFEVFLKRKINQVPHLFKKMPIAIDLSIVNSEENYLSQIENIVFIINKLNLIFIGYINPLKKDRIFINEQGYAVFFENNNNNNIFVNKEKEESEVKEDKFSKEEIIEKIKELSPPSEGIMFHEGVVRSGQTIFAKNKTLVILGSVRNGAEIIADGDIFVFGKIEGKAIAGASGLSDKIIVALKINPFLISIGGSYKTFEESDPMIGKENVKISFKNNKFNFEDFTF